MRLIDADDLRVYVVGGRCNGKITAKTLVEEALIKIFEEAPTVDAEPVRHGHWIDEGTYADNFPHHAWRCSECGWHELEIEEPDGNYCRNCGAKMERKEQTVKLPHTSEYIMRGTSNGWGEYVGELIRCKDCKYSVDEYGDGDCYCDYDRNLNYIGKNWNHYCGWAVRKEE